MKTDLNSARNNQPLVIIFHHFGPYHLARIRGASMFGSVHGIELSGSPDVYAWEKSETENETFEISVLQNADGPQSNLAGILEAKLEELNPCAVAINGWWEPGARAALFWCRKTGTPAIVMSESQPDDGSRSGPKEWIKKKIVGLFDAALVGGKSHARYLNQMGMDRQNIFRGYDAIENEWFQTESQECRENDLEVRESLGLSRPFFLTSNRFVPKKNLIMLLDAWTDYRRVVPDPLDIVLLGDGDMRRQLELKAKFAGLIEHVHFPGFRQVNELPQFFGTASGFVHASTHEQWGLVINEAMASGVPVIASNRCGATREMIRDGKNGFVFNPHDRYELMETLVRFHEEILSDEKKRNRMINHASKTIDRYSPRVFGENIWKAVHAAKKNAESNTGQKKWIGEKILTMMNKTGQLPGRKVS